MLCKEYVDCPQRDSHAVHYILKRGERGVCTLVLCSLATVTSCIDPSVRIVTKSPKGRPLLIFSISRSRMEARKPFLPVPTHVITKQRRSKDCRSLNLIFFGARTHHAGRIHSQDDGSIHLKQKMEHLRPERICRGKSRTKFKDFPAYVCTVFIRQFDCY